jgi:DNA-binding NtrC family response regulator
LVVDDEAMICDLLRTILEDDYQVICETTSHEAIRVLAEQSIDVMLLDYGLPGGGAVEVGRLANEIGVPMAWITGDHTLEVESHPVLFKPFHIDRVSEVLTEVRNSRRLITKPPRQAEEAP